MTGTSLDASVTDQRLAVAFMHSAEATVARLTYGRLLISGRPGTKRIPASKNADFAMVSPVPSMIL